MKRETSSKISLCLMIVLVCLSACQKTKEDAPTVTPASLRDVPAQRLNFRFEADVPPPPDASLNVLDEKNPAIQADFDQNRPQETLVQLVFSPDKKRILVVYRKEGDLELTYRLDMYSAEGKLISKITPNGLAVYYPDTIVWSPDNNNVAFVGITRTGQTVPTPIPDAPQLPSIDNNSNVADTIDANSNSNANNEKNPTKTADKQVLTFRTEQIYICNAEGGDLKPLTQNEGFIYFYFVWSPDSSALISLAATWKEWQYMQYQANQKGEIFQPIGRPRLVEKTGRLRLLDDNLTPVHPVWSPDSAKVALGFDKEVRIYDAVADAPTQSAIPMRNELLIASQKYDLEMQKEAAANSNTNTKTNSNTNSSPTTNANTGANQDVHTLPDEGSLISFTPIVQLQWTDEKILYLETGFIKEFKDSTQNAHNLLRWHRLLLSPQAIKLNEK